MKKLHLTVVATFVAMILVLALTGCGGSGNGDSSTPSSNTNLPDYSNSANWLARPSAGTATKKVDVFFIYPTTYEQSNPDDPIVCSIDNPQMQSGAKSAFARDATVFEPLANIFAPYYEQAAISVLELPYDEQQKIVGGTPTSDCIAAFDYFIKHYNEERPFILASHSQGSNIMTYLLSDYMKDNPEVYERMIAVYMPGYSITPEYLEENPELRFATGPDDTGVIISYNTQSPTFTGTNPVVLPGAMVINPISWTRSEAEAPASENLGSIEIGSDLYPVTDPQGNIKKVMNQADAKIDLSKNALICSTVDPSTLAPGNKMVEEGIYHSFDYPFYYFNLRENAANRIAIYFAKEDSKK